MTSRKELNPVEARDSTWEKNHLFNWKVIAFPLKSGSERVKRNRSFLMKVHASSPHLSNHLLKAVFGKTTRGLLATLLVISPPEMAPPSPSFHTTPTGGRLSFDRFNVHYSPTRRVFSGTRLELMTRQSRAHYLSH
ncbi:hypothetical protein TNCV_2374851 [Trichonephila clavipes]|nr:hypothetical protein TNCV_2374851 [Trichonephila clavipes]